MLHAERRRQNFSVGDVSRQLKLAIRQVEALERDEYKMFGGPVFVHGFLRNYAKLLGLDAASLIAAADRKMEADGIVRAAKKNQEFEDAANEHPAAEDSKKSVVPLFITAAILIAGIAGWMLMRGDETTPGDEAAATATQPEMVRSESRQSEPGQTEPGQTEPSEAEPGQSQRTQSPLTEPGADVSQSPASATATAANASTQGSSTPAARVHEGPVGVLQFDFFEDSWVEVTDRYGDVIYSNLNPAGVSRRVTGYPPLTVVIGNATGTVLTYNDKAIDLAPHTRVDVARLTVE
jgi:cytoskeleton protein RodZ